MGRPPENTAQPACDIRDQTGCNSRAQARTIWRLALTSRPGADAPGASQARAITAKARTFLSHVAWG